MAQVVGEEIPDVVTATFDGTDLERKLGLGFVMVTVDPDGQARPCMVSAGEMLVLDRRTIRLGLWSGTSTSRNLAAGSAVLFCHVAEGVVYYLRGHARSLAADPEARLDCFELRVERVETDAHEGLPVTSGITFTVVDPDPPAVLAMWERQLAVIRAAS
ncbi:MAG: hypothetical protein GEV28_22330 [Actinophytocola sp.]|uniref:hypothetical protein n=1 Tax=Actinophytocola sp. TaxID=1872138 RepID=UPI001326280F|nr:hypothetical protein [Actinophytocola sp.]MPZ82978.1 hypothetical protein [Actinophytocola sp.]